MNPSLLHADILLRDRARERDNHVEEGRILRALDAAVPRRPSGRQDLSPGNVDQPAGVRTRISRLWRGVRLPEPPGERRAPHPNTPLLRAAE